MATDHALDCTQGFLEEGDTLKVNFPIPDNLSVLSF
jgi:hypothetical protein